MLMSDGSTTRHLQLLTGDEVEVDLIAMQPETELSPQCPDGVQDLVAPYLRRPQRGAAAWGAAVPCAVPGQQLHGHHD